MRDYWLTQDLLKTAGFGFIALSMLGIGLALWLPTKWWGKLLAFMVVVLLISIPVRKGTQEMQQQKVAADDSKARYAKLKQSSMNGARRQGRRFTRPWKALTGSCC